MYPKSGLYARTCIHLSIPQDNPKRWQVLSQYLDSHQWRHRSLRSGKGTCLDWVIHLDLFSLITVRGGGGAGSSPGRVLLRTSLPSCLPCLFSPWKLRRAPQDQPQTAWQGQQAWCLWETGTSCSAWPSWVEFFSLRLLRVPPHLSQAISTNCSVIYMLSVEREDYWYHQHKYHYQKTPRDPRSQPRNWKKKKTELAIDNTLLQHTQGASWATRNMGCSYKLLKKFQSCKVCTLLSWTLRQFFPQLVCFFGTGLLKLE